MFRHVENVLRMAQWPATTVTLALQSAVYCEVSSRPTAMYFTHSQKPYRISMLISHRLLHSKQFYVHVWRIFAVFVLPRPGFVDQADNISTNIFTSAAGDSSLTYHTHVNVVTKHKQALLNHVIGRSCHVPVRKTLAVLYCGNFQISPWPSTPPLKKTRSWKKQILS